MKLFIGNIPGEALLLDIYAFLGGLPLRADFQARQGKTRDSRCYHYVVAELQDMQDIENVIRQYDGISFQGKPLVVRQFQERIPCDDWQGEDQRVNALSIH